MARKKKSVVRRKTRPTKGKKHVAKKRSRKVPHKRASRVSRKRVTRPARKRVPATRRAKPARKVAPRKHATRKRQAPRIDPQRAELLLNQISNRIAKAKSPATVRKLQKELADVLRERRALGFRTSFSEGGGSDAPDTPTLPREYYGDEDDEDGEDEDFIGPEGDSYDDAFEDIDWDEVDWGDIIDDIGDEDEDAYSGADAQK
jgi:hypothetical protein